MTKRTKRELPFSLLEKQEKQRHETLSVIQKAIDDLKSEGTIVTKSLLIELSGYSASTFSKPHVKSLLEKNEVCQFQKRRTVQSRREEFQQKKQHQQYEQLQKKYNQLENKLFDKQIRITVLEEELEKQKMKNKRLLGKLHEIMRRAESKGINIT